MPDHSITLIQGFFYEDETWPGIRTAVPGEPRGRQNEDGPYERMYAGVIYNSGPRQDCGYMFDAYGSSELVDLAISSTEFTFCKRYVEGALSHEVIQCVLEPKDGAWLGEYDVYRGGKFVRTGTMSCMITTVPAVMYLPVLANGL